MGTFKGSLMRAHREQSGQSSVEYALALGAFLSVVLVLGLVWRSVGQGGLQRASERAASHAIEGEAAIDGARDLVLF